MCKKIDEMMEENAKLKQGLARVEAEREALRLTVLHQSQRYDELMPMLELVTQERDTAQAQLAEAVGLLCAIEASKPLFNPDGVVTLKSLQAFLARHAQAVHGDDK